MADEQEDGGGAIVVSFRPRLGRLLGCHSDLGWGDYRGVIHIQGNMADE